MKITFHSIIGPLCLAVILNLFCGLPARSQSHPKIPHVVFLISDDPINYSAEITIPAFADSLQKSGLFKTTVLKGHGEHESYGFKGLEVLNKADVLVVFFRRSALSHRQMDQVKSYIKSGRSVVGIRSADHSFSVRGKPAAAGYEGWWGFVPDILGHEYKGHDADELGTVISVNPSSAAHPILQGISLAKEWKSRGGTYRVSPLIDPKSVVLLEGSNPNLKEPVAWTRTNDYGGKVFYTSLGHPTDFAEQRFRLLFANALKWAGSKM
ncbi:hypothetical protein GCM10023091_02370 [Ravibacter arvi]|uniref:ThuA-like domain-containing protein n=1 Tax=Ravibacter arvi TaxID=2051041 RepID=A0ABP8LM59_9BACT